ncbi:MAG: extracellular solute-binding protein, partial [Clostridia bacterium]|nr:extracellular solute-binding protein [Clostridia bacterium]
MKKNLFVRLFAVLLTLGMLAALAVGFSSCGKDENVLYVCNWGEYISDGSEGSLDVVKEFEKTYGIKVKYDYFSTNEELYAQLKSGASYDVVIPSDYMIARLIKDDLIQKIDPAELENYENIDPAYKGLYFDPNDEYSVPYSVGMVGIVYNTKKVSEAEVAEQSWSLLWSDKYRTGELINMNNPR